MSNVIAMPRKTEASKARVEKLRKEGVAILSDCQRERDEQAERALVRNQILTEMDLLMRKAVLLLGVNDATFAISLALQNAKGGVEAVVSEEF